MIEMDPLRVFAHLNADKAALYRQIMGVFTDAKDRFRLHLRPAEVAAALADAPGEAPALGGTEAALSQLAEWGNLERHPDTADVATVEDFRRARFLYQISPAGTAAEHALLRFHELLGQRGELQVTALSEIHELLAELCLLASADEGDLDDSKIHRTLSALRERFDELTRRAQAFLNSLQRSIDLQGADLAHFLSYKERLLEYLESFISELRLLQGQIADLFQRLDDAAVERLVAAAARRDLRDALAATAQDREGAVTRWRARFTGLRAWFVRSTDAAPQAEMLRARARTAIPALLGAVAVIHDRRSTRADRVTDLCALARWFAECESDGDAHRLFRAAFGLSPARHLRVNADTLARWDQDPVPPSTSWLEASPVLLALRLRQTGRHVRPGRPDSVIDRSAEKALLRSVAEREAAELRRARRQLCAGAELRLSTLAALDEGEFRLLLDLLSTALSHKSRAEATVEATSTDGTLHISLRPTGDGATAVIHTALGVLRGPDHFLTITELFPL